MIRDAVTNLNNNIFWKKQYEQDMWIHQIIEKCKDNKPIELFENGEQLRDWIYVDDVIDANIKASSCNDSGIFNVGYGRPYSFNYLTNTIIGMTHSSSKIKYIACNFSDKYQYHTAASMNKSNKIIRYYQQKESQEFWKLGYYWWNGWWNTEKKSIRHELIEYIWRYHCPLSSPISLDGFEHWVGIQQANDTTKNDAGEWALTTHFDKDEKLWDETGKVVTPKLGTIFYPDPCNDEIEGGYLKVWKTHETNFNAPFELIEPNTIV